MNITCIILTKNEAGNIKDCLHALKWCDELIVIDDNSDDKTIDIAEGLGAKVYKRFLDNDFAAQRNFGLSKAKNEWVLFVDADERVSPALIFEISNVIGLGGQECSGFYARRTDVMWGKQLEYGETGGIKLLRLAKRNTGLWEGHVHERWKVKGKIGELKNPLLHYPHQTIKEFLQDINFYTSLRAKELYAKDKRVTMIEIILYTLGKFVVNYFIKRGFLDGAPGIIYAAIMSFHSFLVRAKLWNISNKK